MKIIVVTEEELRSCVSMDKESMAAVEDGFTKLAQGKVSLPPILSFVVPESSGGGDIKTAHIHGLENFTVKIGTGFINNRELGLPTGSGMMIVFSAKTGFPQAVLLDNGYLTRVRTGLAGAIVAKHLAPERIETVGVIGSGSQARFQIEALKLVREFNKVIVYGIIPEEVERYVEEMPQELGVEVIKAKSLESLVAQSNFVVTTTTSYEPFLKAEWLHPGLHITCMGADRENKQEVYPEVFKRVHRIVCDRKSQCFELGDLHHALDAGIISPEDEVYELGELTSGQKPGRQSDAEITICDLTGVGIQDTTIAHFAYCRVVEKGLGISVGE